MINFVVHKLIANAKQVAQTTSFQMEEQHCLKCGHITQHYYVTFSKPSLNHYNGWRCSSCRHNRDVEKQKVQDYRDTLSCCKCAEGRLGREGGHFDYLDGKNEAYTCKKCFNCEVCGKNLSEAICRVDYGNNYHLHAHVECRPQEENFVRGTNNWKNRGMVVFQ